MRLYTYISYACPCGIIFNGINHLAEVFLLVDKNFSKSRLLSITLHFTICVRKLRRIKNILNKIASNFQYKNHFYFTMNLFGLFAIDFYNFVWNLWPVFSHAMLPLKLVNISIFYINVLSNFILLESDLQHKLDFDASLWIFEYFGCFFSNWPFSIIKYWFYANLNKHSNVCTVIPFPLWIFIS